MTSLRKCPAASGSKDERIKIWSFNTGACLRSFWTNKNGVHALHLLPNDQLVSGSRDENEGAIKIWKHFTGECIRSLSGPCIRADYFCSYALEDLMITASPNMSLMLWDYNTGERSIELLGGHSKSVTSVCTLGGYLSASASSD
jgi:WD40 repeat protein